ncbi:sensor histidine kinase [Tepidibacillus sp. HK-1]|uniref:sensor histidine kinase n=1 Tax=Tepidibacillus sp. HK-1 TaxID=1883407 RepID=UPI00085877C5|nr:histidine kinase [Tepidibacillus sp. HK-1]GBF10362.1 sensor histidine kinase YpdA [Tepidibacillus sp. HK-1]
MFRFTGIRKKLMIYYLITIILLGATSTFSYYNAKLMLSKVKDIFVDYIYLNNLNNEVTLLTTEVEKYLTSKSSDALLNYYTYYNRLQEKSAKISREPSFELDNLMLKDVGYMIDHLLEETDRAIMAKRGRISSEYIASFKRSNEISEYIKFYINNLLNMKLQNGSAKYQLLTKNMSFISYLNLLLIISSLIINIFLAIFFTYRLTKPIIELSHSAERISKGDFDIEPVKIETNDEINLLVKAFNKMVVNIKSYIDDIKGQAEIENRLKEQEMQNLKMKSLLKDAELKSLQSQINPHFLFNTLNTAAQLAMLEGADKSSQFIDNMSELFRYKLRKLDQPVTLRDELANVKNYMYILKTRFGDRISFNIDIDETILEAKIPCTIIQPIVENAFIHGLEDIERNGEIYLSIKAKGNKIYIEVRDNGKGMNKKEIKAIVSDRSNSSKGHVTGIGLQNVIDRLRLFFNIYDIEEVIKIESVIDRGTSVILMIPNNKDVVYHD